MGMGGLAAGGGRTPPIREEGSSPYEADYPAQSFSAAGPAAGGRTFSGSSGAGVGVGAAGAGGVKRTKSLMQKIKTMVSIFPVCGCVVVFASSKFGFPPSQL